MSEASSESVLKRAEELDALDAILPFDVAAAGLRPS